MTEAKFPIDLYCNAVVRYLDAIEYHDCNLTHDERTQGLQYVHSKTAEYFTQPLPRAVLQHVEPKRIAAVARTISQFVIYCWTKVPRDAQVDVSIYLSIMAVLDDEINSDPSSRMVTFWTDLVQGKQQQHPFWVLLNAHLPQLLRHYDSFCAFNIMRCTIDYFQGNWIEQYNFQGYPGSADFPMFVRRLNCLGGAVGATFFPAKEFDERAIIKELSSVMAHMDGPVSFVNDLFSFYKEYDQGEPNLASNWCTVDGITMEQALERLTDEAIKVSVGLLRVFEDKDPAVYASLRVFIHGYVTWHCCDLRYRMREVYDRRDEVGDAGAQFDQYFEKALSVGWVDPEDWICPVEGFQVDGADSKGSGFQSYEVNAFDLHVDEISSGVPVKC